MGLLAFERPSDPVFAPLVTNDLGASQWKAIDTVRGRAEGKWAGRCATQLRRDTDFIIAAVEGTDSLGEAVVRLEQTLITTRTVLWRRLLHELYLDIGGRVAPGVAGELLKAAPLFETKDLLSDGWVRIIERYLQLQGVLKARHILGTSLDLARSILTRAIREGWGIPQVALELRTKLGMSGHRRR
jgi:hypothetical protein